MMVLFCFKSALLGLGVTDHFTEEGELTHLAINWAHGLTTGTVNLRPLGIT